MIFPDITLDKWLQKYPSLSVEFEECPECGNLVKLDIPYISKDFAGLTSSPCDCGETDICRIFVPISKNMIEKTQMFYSSEIL